VNRRYDQKTVDSEFFKLLGEISAMEVPQTNGGTLAVTQKVGSNEETVLRDSYETRRGMRSKQSFSANPHNVDRD
jgi:hypothetical protein